MWTEIFKDFGIAFFAVWYLLSDLIYTISDSLYAMVFRRYRLPTSTTTKRLWNFGVLLLLVACTLLVRVLQEQLFSLFTSPLDAPLELNEWRS